jgi:hypothetical protein
MTKDTPPPLREQVRTALQQAAREWVEAYSREHEVSIPVAEAALATLADIGGARPGIRAANLRRLLEGRKNMSQEVSDAIAEALGRRFDVFLG